MGEAKKEIDYDTRIAMACDAFIAGRQCGCSRCGETVYPCPAHVVHDFEGQYGIEASTFAERNDLPAPSSPTSWMGS